MASTAGHTRAMRAFARGPWHTGSTFTASAAVVCATALNRRPLPRGSAWRTIDRVQVLPLHQAGVNAPDTKRTWGGSCCSAGSCGGAARVSATVTCAPQHTPAAIAMPGRPGPGSGCAGLAAGSPRLRAACRAHRAWWTRRPQRSRQRPRCPQRAWLGAVTSAKSAPQSPPLPSRRNEARPRGFQAVLVLAAGAASVASNLPVAATSCSDSPRALRALRALLGACMPPGSPSGVPSHPPRPLPAGAWPQRCTGGPGTRGSFGFIAFQRGQPNPGTAAW